MSDAALVEGPANPVPSAGASGAPARRVRATFLGLALLYALFAWPGPPLDPVAARTLGLAEAFSRGSPWIDPRRDLSFDVASTPSCPPGLRAPLYGFGTSLLAAPGCALARAALGDPVAAPQREPLLRFVESSLTLLLVIVPAGALAVVLLARLLGRLGTPRAWETALLFGLSLPFPLATTVGPHITGMALGLIGLTLAAEGRPGWSGAAAGAALGAAALCDFSLLVALVAPCAVWVLAARPLLRISFCAGAAASAALLFLRNQLYFGSPLTAIPPPEQMHPEMAADAALGAFGLLGANGLDPRVLGELLVGERVGLFLFAPVLLLGLVGLPELWRRHRGVCLAVLAVVLLSFLQNALKRAGWFGSTSKGPRYLLPAALALSFPLAFGLERCPRLGLTLGAVGTLVSWVQAQTPFYATFRSALLDLFHFGPRLRLVHSLWGLWRPGEEVSRQVSLISPLLAAPALVLIVRLLAPPAQRRRWTAGVLLVWAAAMILSGALGDPGVTREALRLAEIRRSVAEQPWPHRLAGYGNELLALGQPEEACDCYIRALERGGPASRPLVRQGLAAALTQLDPPARARVLARLAALHQAEAPR